MKKGLFHERLPLEIVLTKAKDEKTNINYTITIKILFLYYMKPFLKKKSLWSLFMHGTSRLIESLRGGSIFDKSNVTSSFQEI